jgi:hypothetical protein
MKTICRVFPDQLNFWRYDIVWSHHFEKKPMILLNIISILVST